MPTLKRVVSFIAIGSCIMMQSACELAYIVVGNQFQMTEFQVRDDQLLMNGIINSQTLDQFEEIYAAATNQYDLLTAPVQ